MYGTPYKITPKQAAQKVLQYFKHKHQMPEKLEEKDLHTACRDVLHLPINMDIYTNYKPLDGSKSQYPSIHEILTELKNYTSQTALSYSF